MDWGQRITTATAIVGAALGVYNTYSARRQIRSRIRVTVERNERGHDVITVSNLSPHSVTLTRLDLLTANGKVRPWQPDPMFNRNVPPPYRIDGRHTETFYDYRMQASPTRPQIGAHAETACGAQAYAFGPLRGMTRLKMRLGWRYSQ